MAPIAPNMDENVGISAAQQNSRKSERNRRSPNTWTPAKEPKYYIKLPVNRKRISRLLAENSPGLDKIEPAQKKMRKEDGNVVAEAHDDVQKAKNHPAMKKLVTEILELPENPTAVQIEKLLKAYCIQQLHLADVIIKRHHVLDRLWWTFLQKQFKVSRAMAEERSPNVHPKHLCVNLINWFMNSDIEHHQLSLPIPNEYHIIW